MVTTVFMNDSYGSLGSADDELTELLQELRETTGKRWVIEETITAKGRFRKHKTWRVALFVKLTEGEYQQLTCVSDLKSAKAYIIGRLSQPSTATLHKTENNLIELRKQIAEIDDLYFSIYLVWCNVTNTAPCGRPGMMLVSTEKEALEQITRRREHIEKLMLEINEYMESTFSYDSD